MGQTLTHGVYLPDEGERNCYSGLAANWQILDTSVGTIAAHTAALAGKAPLVHTHTKADITDFPIYGTTAGVFSYAVRMDLVSDNPCRKVTIPKGEAKEKQIYSQEEMAHLLTAIQGEPLKYKAFFFLIAYSGFRRSEMLGLEWKDIDFENNIITIKRTSNYTAERGIYTDTTKTKRSQRVLKISPYIMGILKDYKLEQDEEALRLGDKWVETDRLFVKWNGEPMNNQTPYGWLKEFCEKNDMPFYGIHSFRHFAASSLISAGLDVTTVSGALGHCNSGTTLNVYSHMFQNAQARVSEAMDKAFAFLPQEDNTDSE